MEKNLDRNGFNYEGTYRPGNSYSFIPCVRCYAWVSWCSLFIRGLIMIKESDIIKESGNYWVLKCSSGFDVMKNGITHSVTIASFGPSQFDLADAYFNYMVKRGIA